MTVATATPPTTGPMDDPFIRNAALICLLGLGGFLAWAGLVPLAEGVPASGQIVVENSRQVVQHLEGGIIHGLLVRDGDLVEAGQPLLTLEETASLSVRDEIMQDIASLTGSLQRLVALRDGRDEPDFSALEAMPLGDAERAEVIERQHDLFQQQRQAFEADIAVLTARRDGARSSRRLQAEQVVLTQRVLEAAQEQLELLRNRVDRQMARLDELRAMERDVASLEAEISRLRTEAQAAANLERDLEGQIGQAEATFARQISTEQLEVRVQLQQAEERLNSAQDILNRSVITAPLSGEILNLRFSTRGGVVRPGEAILEIVPEVGEVTASVRIRPAQRAAVYAGQNVRIRMSAFKSWLTPQLDGTVVSVSADLKTDEVSGASYYEVRVTVPASELEKLGDREIIPGMPVEVFIFSGRSRTTLDYLFEPISESLFRGARSG
ncbi:HlyD family type I secretion periplasmic adaptor subunit [Maricaulis sp.]|uniref:HlyD family type I secretion periplasmic adaptor subunit n=1 Tax=Maricaulis sp. TaxID=1486257 RepID=UPI003A944472